MLRGVAKVVVNLDVTKFDGEVHSVRRLGVQSRDEPTSASQNSKHALAVFLSISINQER